MQLYTITKVSRRAIRHSHIPNKRYNRAATIKKQRIKMETRKGLLTKLAGFSAVAIGLTVVGKYHIASVKDTRHRKESDSSLESESEFLDTTRRPGFPSSNPNLNYESAQRESKYVGAGVAYSTRTKGDRLSIWNVLTARGSDENE